MLQHDLLYRDMLSGKMLGLLISFKDCLERIEYIDEDLFNRTRDRKIFNAIKDTYEKYGSCDLVMLADVMKSKYPKDGIDLILDAVNYASIVVSAEEFDSVIQRLRDRKSRLAALKEIREGMDLLKTEDFQTARMKLQSAYTKIGMSNGKYNLLDFDKIKIETIKTGFDEYDRLTGGLYLKEIHTFLSRPGHGKTTFSINLAYKLAKMGRKVAYFSCEMSAEIMLSKLISMFISVPNRLVLKGISYISQHRQLIESEMDYLKDYLFIYDNAYDVGDMMSIADNEGFDVIIIDHVEAMRMPDDKVRIAIWKIYETLKEYAKSNSVAIVMMAQVSREMEKRNAMSNTNNGNKLSVEMSDAAESSAIEWFSAYMTFLFWPFIKSGQDDGRLYLIIKKARYGGLGRVILSFDKSSSKIDNLQVK